MSRSRHLRLPAALAALVLSGCAAMQAAQSNLRVPGTLANDQFTPGRPASATFGDPAVAACPVGGAYTELYAKVAEGAKAVGATPAPAEGRLCAVAEALLGWPEETPVAEGPLAFLSGHYGLENLAGQAFVTTLETEDPREIAKNLAATIASYGSKVPTAAYGVASTRLKKDRTKVVLVLANASIRLDPPLPRRLEAGQKAALSGTLQGDLDTPKVLVSDAQGKVATFEQPAGKAFKAEVACGQQPGRIVAEIRGEEMGNERVLSTLEVACASPLPTTASLAKAAWPADAAGQERKITELINAERTAAGLPALAVSDPVGKVARAVAESLRANGQKPGSAQPVNLVQKLAEADVSTPVILQNPAAAPTAEQAYRRLMVSPSHRANVMSTEVNTFGVGVAAGEDAAKHQLTYLTQIFIKIQPPPDLAAYKATVREVIARKRAAEKLAPVTEDAGLAQLAQDYAAAVAAAEGKPSKATYENLVKALNKGFRSVDLLTSVKLDPADYAEEPNLLSKGKLLGLGAALGKHPAYGKNSVFLVMLIASRR